MYTTFYKARQQTQQITLFTTNTITEHYNETVTTTNAPSDRMIAAAARIERTLLQHIRNFNEFYLPIIQEKPLTERYYQFRIPKASGGFREINAPDTTLKEAQTKIVELFHNILRMHTHNAAFAYTKCRSITDALKIHQKNESNWFLKLDIKSFFPNCTQALLQEKLSQMYPIALFSENTKTELFTLLNICFLNNELPQGSPASPYLSNLLFTDFDYRITQFLNGTGIPILQKYVYTRYADDILISAKRSFSFQPIVQKISEIINPFILKQEKTRYGSKAGKNWNLGLMLNKDNQITTGHVNKKNLKAMLFNFICKTKINNVTIGIDPTLASKAEARHLLGVLNYAKQIEPGYINYLLTALSRKTERNIEDAIKKVIKEGSN